MRTAALYAVAIALLTAAVALVRFAESADHLAGALRLATSELRKINGETP